MEIDVMKSFKYIFGAVLLLAGLSACSDDSSDPVAPPLTNQTRTLEVSEEAWTYLNLTTGEVVGTSPLGDETADEQWKNRTDWDLAFCGDMVRTNSGTSGRGQGGLQVLDEPYATVLEAPYEGYAVDTDDNEVWK